MTHLTHTSKPSRIVDRIDLVTEKPLNECTAAELAAHYRAQNLDRYVAWDKYIIDRAMRPEMNAEEFYRLFDAVTPAQLPAVSREVEFVPTHMDTLTNHLVMICGDGPWELVWDTGYHGRNPLCCPPEADRFVPIVEMQSTEPRRE